MSTRLDGAETLFENFEELYELYDGIRNKNGRQLVNVPIAQRENCITKGTIWGAASPALTRALFKDSNGICLKPSSRFPIPGGLALFNILIRMRCSPFSFDVNVQNKQVHGHGI
jgi:hypothetical protein